jgi:hypothetical protein
MTKLGLGYGAVLWATTASPKDIAYLTPGKAKQLGIQLTVIDPDDDCDDWLRGEPIQPAFGNSPLVVNGALHHGLALTCIVLLRWLFYRKCHPHFCLRIYGACIPKAVCKASRQGAFFFNGQCVWGFFNIVVAYLLLAHVGSFDWRATNHIVAFGSGLLVRRATGSETRLIPSDRLPGYSKETVDIEVLQGNHEWREVATACGSRPVKTAQHYGLSAVGGGQRR